MSSKPKPTQRPNALRRVRLSSRAGTNASSSVSRCALILGQTSGTKATPASTPRITARASRLSSKSASRGSRRVRLGVSARATRLFVVQPGPRRSRLAPALQACAILLALLMPAGACADADYAREKRWADEVVPGILVGKPVALELASGRRFLAIYAAAGKDLPGVVIVHGAGLHPDWGLNGVLRSSLADSGYATLAVQMPVLGADARGEQY